MNKKGITAVIGLMALSLLGIIAFQLYWFQQAYQVKEEQFDRSVQEALTRVAAKLETHEAADVIRDRLQHYQPPADPIAVKNPAPATSRVAPAETRPALRPETGKKGRLTITTDSVVIFRTQGKTKIKSGRNNWQQQTGPDLSPRFSAGTATLMHLDTAALRQLMVMTSALDTLWLQEQVSRNLLRVADNEAERLLLQLDTLVPAPLPAPRLIKGMEVVLDTLTIRHVWKGGGPQEMALVRAPRQRPLQIYRPSDPAFFLPATAGHPVSVAGGISPPLPRPASKLPVNRERIVRKVQNKTNKFTDVLQKMAVEYIRKTLPLEKRLTRGKLDTLLGKELANQGIALSYDFAVLRQGRAPYLALQTVGFRPALAHGYHQVQLFPNDIEIQPNFLALQFPGKSRYILHSLKVMMAFSALFTVIILSTFLVSIHIILKQKKISEVRNDFINNMTHEFKTPLATISLAIDSIENPKVLENRDRVRQYTGIIRQENKRMNKQVEQVLQMALLDKQELKLHCQPVDMHALIDQAVRNMALLLESKGGTIVIHPRATDFWVDGDEAHLGHVISNLLDNAIKYSPRPPEITVLTDNTSQGLVLAVEDKGLGMSKDTQRKIFDKFYRVSTGNIHDIKGFGLGLSYVKAIMQAHKGTVTVKSEPGRGSRFELVFPLKVVSGE